MGGGTACPGDEDLLVCQDEADTEQLPERDRLFCSPLCHSCWSASARGERSGLGVTDEGARGY